MSNTKFGDGHSEGLAELIRQKVEPPPMYKVVLHNDDYTSVVNGRNYERLQGSLADAKEKGAELIEVNPGGEDFTASNGNKMPLTIVRGVNDDMKVMQEEIFGPILPIRGYAALDDAIAHVERHDRPLALYPFSHDRGRVEKILRHTLAGGVTVNDTVLHFGINALPFGGIGPSGMGAYHGRAGFDAMSKALPVLWQPRRAGSDLLKPPYSKVARFIDFIIR